MNGMTDLIEKLRKSFYVDNCVTSLPDYNALCLFMEKASEVFAGVKFELTGWEYTDPDVESPSCTAVLEMSWDKKEDNLGVDSVCVEKDGVITRRTILSWRSECLILSGLLYLPCFIVP
jgi:hypothetical protein